VYNVSTSGDGGLAPVSNCGGGSSASVSSCVGWGEIGSQIAGGSRRYRFQDGCKVGMVSGMREIKGNMLSMVNSSVCLLRIYGAFGTKWHELSPVCLTEVGLLSSELVCQELSGYKRVGGY